MSNDKTGFKASLSQIDNLISSFERYHKLYPNAKFGEQVAILKHERAELANKIGKLNLKEEELNEDLSTPLFSGDDISSNSALQYWTSLMSVLSSLDNTVQDNANKLAILNSLTGMVSSKVLALTHPAQASIAAVTAATVPAPNAASPSMTVMPDAMPGVNTTLSSSPVPSINVNQSGNAKSEIEVEDEEEIQSDEPIKTPQEVNPSTEIEVPITASPVNPEDKANDEADTDKKAVVDLTMETKDQIDDGGFITSFKEWAGINFKDTSDHTKKLSNEVIIKVASMNEACLRGQALIQRISAKTEASKRSLDIKKNNINESTERMMRLAGIK